MLAYRVAVVYKIRRVDCHEFTQKPVWGSRELPYPPRKTVPEKSLVVMSMNIQGHAALVRGDHLKRIAQAILEARPDIVGLQELHRGTWQARFEDQVGELARLTGMNVYYRPSAWFLGGEYGNAVLTRGRIVGGEVFPLTSFGEPRALLKCTIEIQGAHMNVFVAHLATWGGLNRRSRTAQLNCIDQHLRNSEYPFVLVGDFNTTPDTPELMEFRGKNRLQFVTEKAGATHRITGQQIDYIFADTGWEVLSGRVLDSGPSDHSPLLAELSWMRKIHDPSQELTLGSRAP